MAFDVLFFLNKYQIKYQIDDMIIFYISTSCSIKKIINAIVKIQIF